MVVTEAEREVLEDIEAVGVVEGEGVRVEDVDEEKEVEGVEE